jgi:uncharacterized membrane protein YbhN (UPF0104 family)
VLCAVLALAWVLYTIPWHDVVIVRSAGASAEVEGLLIGDWKSDSVRFRPAAPLGDLPRGLAELPREADGAFALVRTHPGDHAPPQGTANSFDWRPGMLRVFAEMNARALALALCMFVLGQLIIVTRWWRLLSAAGLRVPWYESLRLTSLGLFFNLVVPGLTGGDLVKALLAARAHPTKRHAALVSIAFDRVLGLLCMAVLAAVAVLVSGETFAAIRTPVVAAAGAGVLLGAATMSRGLRRAVGLERLLARLPLASTIQKLDEAVLTYSTRPGELAACVLLSFLNHLCMITGILVLGRAFGDSVLPWSSYFAIAPVATIISAIPIAPGGWGVREAAYSSLFALLGGSAAIGLATSISFGLLQMSISLVAGLFLFAPGSARISEMKDLRKTPA